MKYRFRILAIAALIFAGCSSGSPSNNQQAANPDAPTPETCLAGQPCYVTAQFDVCKGPAPGCDYIINSNDKGYHLMTLAEDPYYNPNFYSTTPWTSPDGIIYSSGGPNGTATNSVHSDVKDVDLQKSQQQDLSDQAQAIADHFQMSLESATKLTQLADQLVRLQSQGQMTDEDRSALATSALAIGGIDPKDVNAALARVVSNGDKSGIDALVDRAASNLGMPSSASLRDELLPSLGIKL